MYYFLNLCFVLALCWSSLVGHAQNLPVYNSYYVNPYLYNPAESMTEYTQIFATHRQQWTNIEGAPTLSTLTFTTLMNESRAGVGGKISSYKRGLLNTTDFQMSYAYAMPTGGKNWLFFGLSAGAISNTIDVARASDPNDPALAGSNNMQPAAAFGMLYRSSSGLNLGFSLPQMFPSTYNTPQSFGNTTVAPGDQVFITMYYRRKVESKIVSRSHGKLRKKVKTQETIAPLEFYFNYRYAKAGNSQFEFLGKLNLSQYFWLGGSYRLPYGFTGNVGLQGKRFVLAYAYEPMMQPENGFSQGTHEFTLGLKLGPLKKFKRAIPVLRSTLTKDPTQKHTARFQENVEDPDRIAKAQNPEVKKKYYVVIRAFADFNSADVYKRKLITDKFNAEIFYNPQDRKYYVHVLETDKATEAHEEIKNLKTYTKLTNARLLIVNTEK